MADKTGNKNTPTMIGAGIVIVVLVIAAVVFYSGKGTAATAYTTTILPTTPVAPTTTVLPTTTVSPTGSNSVVAANTIVPSNSLSSNSVTPVTSVSETFNIVETEFKITPTALQVIAGSTVTFNVSNGGHQTHNFLFVNGISAGIPYLAPGQVQVLTFKAPAAGTYTYMSNFGADNGMGMQGTLIVH